MPEINGTIANDFLTGTSENDTINGLAGNDTIAAGDGDDTVEGGDGDDQLYGELGNDILRGGIGFDTLSGAEGNDQLFGGADNDQLSGWTGDDYLDGGDGIDTLDGGFGNDTILGGAGDDAISNAIGADTIDGGTGFDFLDGVFWSGDSVTTFATASVNVDFSLLWTGGTLLFNGLSLTGIERIGHVGGSNFDDNIVLGAAVAGMEVRSYDGNDTVVGTGFDDTIYGGNGNDILSGGDGADELRGDAGDDTLNGGIGDDLLYTGTGNSTEVLTGGSGADRFLIEGGLTVTITDFADGIDKILLGYIGLGSSLQLAQSMVQTGNDVTITFGGHTLIIQNTLVSQLTASDFLGMLDQSFNPVLVPQLPSLTGSSNLVITNSTPPTVTNSGLLVADNASLPPDFPAYGYRNPFGVQDFSNSGTIVVQVYQGSAWGVHLGWVYGTASNNGSIYAYSYGAATSNSSIAVGADVWGLSTFTNSGLIAAYSRDRAVGVQRPNGGTVLNTATGTILAESNFARAVIVTGVDTGTFVNGVLEHRAVVNYGTIAAHSSDLATPSYGIWASGGISGAQGAIRIFENFGTITADYAICVLQAQEIGFYDLVPRDVVRNQAGGILNGSIFLDIGDDQVINRGTINGLVQTGDDDDLFDNVGGVLNGHADLGFGNDTFLGGSGAEAVAGGMGEDNLAGGGGNDLLLGGYRADLISGDAGNDGLYGEHGNDTLITQDGDFASGGAGNDRIDAGDLTFARLSGDQGTDTLALVGDSRVLDLAGAIQAGRVAGFERIELNGAMGVAIQAGTVNAMNSVGAVLQLTGTGSGTVYLVGAWQALPDRVDGSTVWHRYALGNETIEVSASRTVSVTASAPVTAGLDAIAAGASAPVPGAMGLNATPAVISVEEFYVQTDLVIEPGETWLSEQGSTLFQYGTSVTNYGTAQINNLVPNRTVTGFQNVRTVVNHNIIDIHSETGVAYGLRDSGLTNHGTIYVTSARPAYPGHSAFTAIGFYGAVMQGSNVASTGALENSGLIVVEALGAGATSIGILALAPYLYGNGDPALYPNLIFADINNSGTIAADIAILVTPDGSSYDPITFGAARINNSGMIYGDILTDIGWDQIHNSGTINGIVSLYGGNDLYNGYNGILNGAVFGEAGNDTLIGGAGVDWFEGGADNDTINGGGGTDRALYSEATAGVTVNLAITGAQDTNGAGTDTLTGIEELLGSAHDDNLTGDGSVNYLEGGAGDDWLTGGGGNDRIVGGNGSNDVAIFSGTRSSYLVEELSIGGVAHFRVTGQGGAASDGVDLLSGVEILRFTDQDMRIGNSRPDLGSTPIPDQNFGDGALFTYQIPADAFVDANGDPLTYTVTLGGGGALPAWLSFNSVTRTLSGTPPQSAVGTQIELRVTAADNFPGDPNSFATDYFNLTIFLSPGADVLGTGSNDVLDGTLRNERLFGLDGDDILRGTVGGDQFDGGNGSDIVDYSLTPWGVTVNLATGFGSGGDAEGDSYVSIEGARGTEGGGDELRGGGADEVFYGLGGNDQIYGGDGNDIISGGSGGDYLFGQTGNDRILIDQNSGYGGSWSRYDGGTGLDTLVVSGGVGVLFGEYVDIEVIELTPGAAFTMNGFQFNSGFAANTAITGTGNLSVNMSDGYSFFATLMSVASTVALNVNGTAGVDVIKASLTAAITVNAGDGADQIRGGNLADTILGGDGNDKIMGLGGADNLTGGAGIDQFRFLFTADSGLGAADQITDFVIGTDLLDFRALDSNPVTPGIQGFAFVGTSGFSGGGAAQLRYLTSGSNLIVQGDVNGDGAADMEIVLQGLVGQTLTAAQFMLGTPGQEPLSAKDAAPTVMDPFFSTNLLASTLPGGQLAEVQTSAQTGEPAAAEDLVPDSVATTATLAIGSSVDVAIDTNGDHDWYMVTLQWGATYTFLTSSNGAQSDAYLTLRDGNGIALASNDDGGDGFNALISYTAPGTGTYYIDAGTYNNLSTGSFHLSVARTSSSPYDSVGATTASAGTLAIGGAWNSAIETEQDHDYYAVNLVAGQTYVFRTAPTTPFGSTDTNLWLRDASGAELAFNGDAGEALFSAIRYTATSTGTYYLDVGAAYQVTGAYNLTAFTAPSVPLFTNDQIAAQLTEGYWGGQARHWDVVSGGSLSVDLTALTAGGQSLARAALDLWSDASGIVFNEVASGGQLVFDDASAGAYTTMVEAGGIISSAQVNISTFWLTTYGASIYSYSFQTYIHEIGHALGLGHAGNYNGYADYVTGSHYLNDSWATTVMSYFDQDENNWFTGEGFTRQFVATPLVADLIAIANLYGAPTGTRTGDTVYGRDNTSGRSSYDAYGSPLTVTIIDNGGIDTLNYSGYRADQRIDLNAESFSNVGGQIGNLTIARGTVIENAIGGLRRDVVIGNAANNRLEGGSDIDELTGGGGADTLIGGGGADTAVYGGNRADYTVTTVGAVTTVTGLGTRAGDGSDTLAEIESIRFADQTLALGGDPNNPVELGDTGLSSYWFEDGAEFLIFLPRDAFFDLDGTALTYTATLPDGSPLPDWLQFDPASQTYPGSQVFSGVPPVSAIGTSIRIRVTASDQSSSISSEFDLMIAMAQGVPVEGTSEADLLHGTFRIETMTGYAGDDRFFGSPNGDTIYGGDGAGDVVDYGASNAAVEVSLSSINGPAYGFGLGGDAEGDTLLDIEGLSGSAYADRLIGNGFDNLLVGMAGDDVLSGMGGTDTLYGGDGNDSLEILEGSSSTVDGGTGHDTLRVFGAVSLAGLAGIETIDLGGGAALTLSGAQFNAWVPANVAVTGSGSFTIDMTAGAAFIATGMTLVEGIVLTVNGTIGTDVIKSAISASSTINGGDGTDQLRGGNLWDIIDGGSGNDKIFGLGGADTLTGGAGNDQFRYLFTADSGTDSEADRITDFTIGEDRLDMRMLDSDPLNAGIQGFSFVGADAFHATGTAEIRYWDGDADILVDLDLDGDGVADMQIVLQGLAGQTLSASDFMFAAAGAEPLLSPKDAALSVMDPLFSAAKLPAQDLAIDEPLLDVSYVDPFSFPDHGLDRWATPQWDWLPVG